MKPNTKHLLKSWAVVVVVGCLLLVVSAVGTIRGLRRGEYTSVIALGVGVAVAAISIVGARRKALLFFKEPNPDRAIEYYHRSTKRIPNGKAMAAYMSAFAAVLYGQFDRAREELASVNWAAFPPLYQGLEVYIHSLLAIFEAKDYSRALRLAEEARDLCDASATFPGAKTSRVALDANVAVCELLVGKNASGLLRRLDKASKTLPGVSPAIPAWALAAYHTKAGESAAAQEYVSIVKRLLPHAIPLNNLQPGTRS